MRLRSRPGGGLDNTAMPSWLVPLRPLAAALSAGLLTLDSDASGTALAGRIQRKRWIRSSSPVPLPMRRGLAAPSPPLPPPLLLDVRVNGF